MLNKNTYKHLNLSQRIIIESCLRNNDSFRSIARNIDKSINTVIKEVVKRRVFTKGKVFNLGSLICLKLERSPYVCNGCNKNKNCRNHKYFYYAFDAQVNYQDILVNARVGIDMDSEQFHHLNDVVKTAIDNGHSFNMIIANNPELNISIRTLYNYQEKQYLSTKNIDLPRKVRYKKRKVADKHSARKERAILNGRRFIDWLSYIEANNITYYSQMDTVEGVKGHSVLLTLTLIDTKILLAFKLFNKDSEQVSACFVNLKHTLGLENFHKVFPYILTDNGTEFFKVLIIEDNGPDIKETKVFFCDPYRSDQKGAIEVAHQYIRRFIPKGKDLDALSEKDIALMINHINNTPRLSLNNQTPYQLLVTKYGQDIADKLGLSYLAPNKVKLNFSLFNSSRGYH